MSEIVGVKIGDGYVSVQDAQRDIYRFLCRMVGDPDGGGKRAPDMKFAMDVIRQTIPEDAMAGEKLQRYQRSMAILETVYEKLCWIRDEIDSLAELKDEICDFLIQTAGPIKDDDRAAELVFALYEIKKALPRERTDVLVGEKRFRYLKALRILWSLRDTLCRMDVKIRLFWPNESE